MYNEVKLVLLHWVFLNGIIPSIFLRLLLIFFSKNPQVYVVWFYEKYLNVDLFARLLQLSRFCSFTSG
jgi:hypothetical protein